MEYHRMWNNESYEDIEQFVKDDLSEYGQDNPCPISQTVLLGDGMFRHYELGSIIGFVLWNEWHEYDGKKQMALMISQVNEDDEYWFAPRTPMYMAASWMNDMKKTITRMHKWYHERFIDGGKDGKWVLEEIKPVEQEIKYGKGGEPGTWLFATPSKD